MFSLHRYVKIMNLRSPKKRDANISRSTPSFQCLYFPSKSLHRSFDPLSYLLDPETRETKAYLGVDARLAGNRNGGSISESLAELLALPRAILVILRSSLHVSPVSYLPPRLRLARCAYLGVDAKLAGNSDGGSLSESSAELLALPRAILAILRRSLRA